MIDSRPGKPLQTLLLVDDSPDNLAILAGHLNNDYVISQAASGAEALRLIQTELSPDLILLDVLMPGMDGYEVFRRLAALPCARDIPVIFITALDEAQNEVAAIEMGAVDFVSKPINHVILKARIRNHLQYKALRDELRNQSMMDSLTALANRRRFMEALSAEWFRAVRYSTWLAILFIDIDDFKQYNDRYGHIAGDDCLKAVASAIRDVALDKIVAAKVAKARAEVQTNRRLGYEATDGIPGRGRGPQAANTEEAFAQKVETANQLLQEGYPPNEISGMFTRDEFKKYLGLRRNKADEMRRRLEELRSINA